jgi:hypothetical protein
MWKWHCAEAQNLLIAMKIQSCLASVAALAFLTLPASAGFHFMQIEQVIGGVNGNSSAQAIQLRLRGGGQNIVSAASLWAWDAAGSNRVLLLNIGTDVSNSAGGARVLLTTPAFTSAMNLGGPAFAPDFTLTNAIPASYLTAGRITFEADGGTVASPGVIYWSLSWGGASYTGPNTGDSTNDGNGNFGPAFGSALPTSSRQGVLFTGAAADASTSNSTDYALSANPATVTRNSGTAFTVVPEPGSIAVFGALSLSVLILSRRRVKAA